MRFEYTVTAKTVDEAYKKAIDLYSALGEISMDEIISRGKKGFLGFGSVLAEIRISVDDGKEEKSNKQTPPSKTVKGNAAVSGKPQDTASAQTPVSHESVRTVNKSHSGSHLPGKSADSAPKEKRAGDNAQKNRPQKKEHMQSNDSPEGYERERIRDEDIHVNATEKKVTIDFLNSFIKNINFNCEAKGDLTPDENGFVTRTVEIVGEDASALIGHHGETLDALQYLANLCLARKCEGEHKEYVKVTLDIEGYRAKREQSLRALARRMGEKAIKYRRNVLLEPMNPYERRIIHSEIQGMEGISTHSVGYDDNRKIVITYDGKK